MDITKGFRLYLESRNMFRKSFRLMSTWQFKDCREETRLLQTKSIEPRNFSMAQDLSAYFHDIPDAGNASQDAMRVMSLVDYRMQRAVMSSAERKFIIISETFRRIRALDSSCLAPSQVLVHLSTLEICLLMSMLQWTMSWSSVLSALI